jgi:hypothetical protein
MINATKLKRRRKLNGESDDEKAKDAKKTKKEKDYKRLSDKKPLKYDGATDPDEYIENARFYISDMEEEPPSKLVQWLLVGISGTARIAIRGFKHEITTPENLFEVIARECRPKGSETAQLENIIQGKDEPVHIFGARIKHQLERMECSRKTYTEHFITQLTKGSLPEISKMLNTQFPNTVEEASKLAEKIEDKVMRSKRTKTKLTSETTEAKVNMLINQDKINNEKFVTTEALDEKFGAVINAIKDMRHTANSNEKEVRQYNRGNWNNQDNNKRFTRGNWNNGNNNGRFVRDDWTRNNGATRQPNWHKVKCYFCGEQGHGYRGCRHATFDDKLLIQNRLSMGERMEPPRPNALNSQTASSNPPMAQH